MALLTLFLSTPKSQAEYQHSVLLPGETNDERGKSGEGYRWLCSSFAEEGSSLIMNLNDHFVEDLGLPTFCDLIDYTYYARAEGDDEYERPWISAEDGLKIAHNLHQCITNPDWDEYCAKQMRREGKFAQRMVPELEDLMARLHLLRKEDTFNLQLVS